MISLYKRGALLTVLCVVSRSLAPQLHLCPAPLLLLGNGICDPAANNPACLFDLGDCCSITCKEPLVLIGPKVCGSHGFDCLDPSTAIDDVNTGGSGSDLSLIHISEPTRPY